MKEASLMLSGQCRVLFSGLQFLVLNIIWGDHLFKYTCEFLGSIILFWYLYYSKISFQEIHNAELSWEKYFNAHLMGLFAFLCTKYDVMTMTSLSELDDA